MPRLAIPLGSTAAQESRRADLDAVRTFHPGVVFFDIGMPNMDGIEVARRARRMPEGHAVLLVALTGWGQEDIRRRCKEAGFDHHLVKPVDLAVMHQFLASLSVRETRTPSH